MKKDMIDDVIKNMTKEYNNIPIPEQLEEKVFEGINTYKKQEKFKNRKVISVIGGVCAAAVMIFVVNTNTTVAHAFSKIPILSAIVKIVDKDTYIRNDKNMEANIARPEIVIEDNSGKTLVIESEKINAQIKDYNEMLIKQYEADVMASGGDGNLTIDLTYDVVTDNDTMYSIRFNQLLIMASGAEFVKIYHLDKETGKMLILSDLFFDQSKYVKVISDNIKKQMKERMEKDESITYFIDSDVKEWDFNEISKDTTFYINKENDLVIVFDEYEVAPGFMGKQEFTIPYQVIKDIVQDKYFN